MKNSLEKITYREIKRSFGRFLAIMCIVMLGAGFLTGLKITQPAMLETLNRYDESNHFFDFEVISTLGLTDGDVAAFASLDGVNYSEGSISTDALFTMPDGKDEVLKAHSMPQDINKLKLRSGRLPENADECVMDALHFDEDAIGTTVTVSQDNSSGTLEMFSGRTYTIVGIVNSPLYINFTRGTTTLGNGTVSGFVYLANSGFTSDFYTEIYVRLAHTGRVYTDEYNNAIDAFRPILEDAVNKRAEVRYNEVTADAKNQYNAALAQYNTGVSDYKSQKQAAEQQFTQAENKLTQAEQQLPASRAQLDAGWKKLNDAQAQLDGQYDAFNTSTADAQAQLDSAKAQLDEGWAEYNAALADYNDNVSKYGSALTLVQKAKVDAMKLKMDAAQAKYEQSASQLESGRKQLDDAQAQINTQRAQLEQGEAQYAAGLQQASDGRTQLEQNKTQADQKFTEAEKKLEAGRLQLADAQAQIGTIPHPTVYTLDRYTNSGFASFESDSGIVEGVAKVFPIFFFLVAALVCVTTMNRMVDEQRTQIGTLKSLGYTSGEIMKGYLLYTGLAAGLGSILGIAIGSVVFPKIIWMGYNIMYAFTDITLVCDWPLFAIVFAAFMACSLLVTWLSCRSELKEVPAELVRPRTPKAGKRILLEKLSFIWNGFSFLQKVSARNIFRYKKRMFMMIVGIAGCTALLLTGFGVNDSITGLAQVQFDEISLYDAAVNFRSPMSAADEQDFLSKCGGTIDDCAFLSMYTVDANVDGKLKSVYLVGTDDEDMTPFMNFAMDGEVQAYPEDGEVLINDNLARILGVSKGDTITLQDSDMDTITLKVSGIFYNVMYNYAYVTMNTLRQAEGFDSNVNAAYVNLTPDADVYEASAKLGGTGYTMAVTVSQETLSLVARSLESMNYIVGLICFCAGALAFIVLYNLTNINIGERIREIATIKVLGFREWETASYVYRENMVLTLMGTAVGIPLGIWLHSFVMSNIRIDMISYQVRILWPSYLLAIVLTIVFAIVVDFVMYFRLQKINMAESLKSVE